MDTRLIKQWEAEVELLKNIIKKRIDPSSQVTVECTKCEGRGWFEVTFDGITPEQEGCPACYGEGEVGVWKRKECKNCYPDGRVPVGDPHYPEDTDMCGKCNGTKYITEPLTYGDKVKCEYFELYRNDIVDGEIGEIKIDNQEWEVVLK